MTPGTRLRSDQQRLGLTAAGPWTTDDVAQPTASLFYANAIVVVGEIRDLGDRQKLPFAGRRVGRPPADVTGRAMAECASSPPRMEVSTLSDRRTFE